VGCGGRSNLTRDLIPLLLKSAVALLGLVEQRLRLAQLRELLIACRHHTGLVAELGCGGSALLVVDADTGFEGGDLGGREEVRSAHGPSVVLCNVSD
jgi:hypothetical protein